MKTEIVDSLANEGIYQLEYFKKQYVYNRRVNKVLVIIPFVVNLV